MAGAVEIVVAAAGHIQKFVADPPDREYFLDHVVSGRGVLLLAIESSIAVGRLYIRLEPAEEEELREGLRGVPLLERFMVEERRRGNGLGRQLIAAAEALLWERGYRRVALGVSPDNRRAIRLYRRLAFKAWRKRVFFVVWRRRTLITFREHMLHDGTTVREPEDCLVYVKTLIPPPHRGQR